MTQQNTIANIRAALGKLATGDLANGSTQLLAALDYRSDVTAPEMPGGATEFVAAFPATNSDTRTERDFLNDAESVRLLFQMNDRHVAESAPRRLFDGAGFNAGNAQSFLFAAVQLRGDGYSRGQYAAFTRELNKRFPMPMVVLLRTASNLITLAFVHRRPNKRDPERDVLGSVSLIREIDAANPHRAHLDILGEISLPRRLKWMDDYGKTRNFDGLLEAWLAALDTEELNKRFYGQLYGWFERALATSQFPSTQARILRNEEHVIRLITRLMFVWFIKEKGLVDGDLFVENKVSQLLKNYDRANGDSYYRAVLQNLFFATLNTEIGQRRFSNRTRDDHRNPSLYRYYGEIDEPDRLVELFGKTPFINGGLFDCLDSFDATGAGGYRIDCFSDNPAHRRLLSIPNRLFFSDAPQGSEPGLIDLFNRYKFTVEENTPAEREVALDPELLGKVFENLLAAVNPETQQTARKETGSYYTPRPVVDYMVDEALVATLAHKATPTDADTDFWQERLRYLLDYDVADAETLFDPEERAAIVCAIAETRVLDPAVGSGAFPMGVLHKLTLVLRRLDPLNQLWEDLQKGLAGRRASDAFNTADSSERESELAEISRTFDQYRDSDFGRKLYLIQNGIYGVDIQPIATQIAKLRFFISLAIEQQPTADAGDNYGIRPLPNLETRFVTADTLMPLYDLQGALTSERIRDLQQDLQENRERHFHANTRRLKEKHRRSDKDLRKELANELQKLGLGTSDANKVASWDPYNQNADAAQWFDASYMFGVHEGFDIIIGNPPYKQIRKGTYPKERFPFSEGRDKGKQNLYKLFVEQSYNLCKSDGTATLIVQKSLMCDLSSAATRQLLLERTQLLHIIEFPERARTRDAQVFSSVTQGTCIYQFLKATPNGRPVKITVGNDTQTIANPQFTEIGIDTISTLWPDLRCLPHIKEGDVAILQRISSNDAVRPLLHYAASIVQGDLNLNTHKNKFSKTRTPVRLMRGTHVSRFVIRYDAATEYCVTDFRRDLVNANQSETFLISQEVMNQQAARRLNFAITTKSENRFLWGHSVNKTKLRNQAHSAAFMALLNSKFMDWFFRITSSNNHVQGYELEQLPIPAMTATDREQLGKLASRVMRAKASNPAADTRDMEEQIDWLVYDLYGLTNEETAVVEDYFWNGTLTEEEEDQALLRAMLEVSIDGPDDFVSEAEVMATLRGLRDSHGN